MRHFEAVPGKPHAATLGIGDSGQAPVCRRSLPLGLVTWRPLPRASWRGPSSHGLEGQPWARAWPVVGGRTGISLGASTGRFEPLLACRWLSAWQSCRSTGLASTWLGLGFGFGFGSGSGLGLGFRV